MRICDVNNFYSPRGGGVRIYHEQKLAYFESREEHSYALVVPSRRAAVRRRGSVSIYEVPALPYVNPAYRFLASARPLITVFDDFRPDLVEVGSAYLMPHLVNRANRGRSFATVGFYHSDYPDTYVGRPLAAVSERLGRRMAALAARHAGRVYRRMTATFAASEYALNKLHDAGVRRLFKTPLGVDTRLFCPARRCADLRQALGDGREKILLFMARLAGEKGIRQLLEAYPLFRDPDKLTLVIVGRGRWQRSVELAAQQYPEMKYIQHLNDHEEVARHMASCDAFLALGRHETFSLTTLEAMACGRIVVAPDSGGAAELVAGAGVLSPYASDGPETLAAAVEAALAVDDEECSRRLRRYATENFAWETSFRRICGFYDRVADALEADDLDRLSPAGKWHE